MLLNYAEEHTLYHIMWQLEGQDNAREKKSLFHFFTVTLTITYKALLSTTAKALSERHPSVYFLTYTDS